MSAARGRGKPFLNQAWTAPPCAVATRSVRERGCGRYSRLQSCCWDFPTPRRSRIIPVTSPIIRIPQPAARRLRSSKSSHRPAEPTGSPWRRWSRTRRGRNAQARRCRCGCRWRRAVEQLRYKQHGYRHDSDLSLNDLCNALYTSAQDNDLPVPFFANLIWQESRLRDDAVSRKGALGIAQFMPETAAETGLDNPFDPLQAIPASARFLRELRLEFGNLGFVAAAYNAGAHRVVEWLEHRGQPAARNARLCRARHRAFRRRLAPHGGQ